MADSDVSLKWETHRQKYGTSETNVSHGKQHGDRVSKQEANGELGEEKGKGKDEEAGD